MFHSQYRIHPAGYDFKLKLFCDEIISLSLYTVKKLNYVKKLGNRLFLNTATLLHGNIQYFLLLFPLISRKTVNKGQRAQGKQTSNTTSLVTGFQMLTMI